MQTNSFAPVHTITSISLVPIFQFQPFLSDDIPKKYPASELNPGLLLTVSHATIRLVSKGSSRMASQS